MAGPYDPFTPGPAVDPRTLPGPDDHGDIMGQIGTFLGDPRLQGGLLSAGLTLMQPRGFAQDGAGQFAQALGAAGASIRQGEASDLKQRESEAKAELAEARAGAAGANAGTREGRATLAEERLKFQQTEAAARAERATQGLQLRALQAYEAVKKSHERSQEMVRAADKKPPPSFGDWLKSRGYYGAPWTKGLDLTTGLPTGGGGGKPALDPDNDPLGFGQ